jgi:hypothetical protein
MPHNKLFRRIYGGLTNEQLAGLSPEILAARAEYLDATDEELFTLHEIEPPKRRFTGTPDSGLIT